MGTLPGLPAVLRVIRSGLIDPALSMALDEALLDSAGDAGRLPTLHLYQRNKPTVSIGYSLSAEDTVDLAACAARGVAVLRRPTGGGAIYTDRWTVLYSISLPDPDDSVEDSFRRWCGVLVKTLERLGIHASFVAPNDVVVEARKISGAAQARRRGGLIHQASVIHAVDRSAMKAVLRPPEDKLVRHAAGDPGARVTSVDEAKGSRVTLELLLKSIEAAHAEALGLRAVGTGFTGPERERAQELRENRFSKPAWNLRIPAGTAPRNPNG